MVIYLHLSLRFFDCTSRFTNIKTHNKLIVLMLNNFCGYCDLCYYDPLTVYPHEISHVKPQEARHVAPHKSTASKKSLIA